MNHIMQRNILELQLKKYMDFLEICPTSDIEKLVVEMLKLNGRIQKLKELNGDELLNKVEFFYETKQSKLNFKTLKIISQ